MNGRILISLAEQSLQWIDSAGKHKTYPVSTARNGSGEQFGSECTPRGLHQIRAKIGADRPVGAVFIGRRWTGEVFERASLNDQPDRDWILSRILWLSGLEPGKNRLGRVDTMRRYIYIHGAPDEWIDGRADSHGCIRMRNADVIELFDAVAVGTQVEIV